MVNTPSLAEEDEFKFPLFDTVGGAFLAAFGIEILVAANMSNTAGNGPKQMGYLTGAALFAAGGYVLQQTLSPYFRNRAILKTCREEFGDNERASEVARRYIRRGPLLGYKERMQASSLEKQL